MSLLLRPTLRSRVLLPRLASTFLRHQSYSAADVPDEFAGAAGGRAVSSGSATSGTSNPLKSSGPGLSARNVSDAPPAVNGDGNVYGESDWARSFQGLSTEPFPKEVSDVLLQPIDPEDVEVKPDGIIYLPEIKYRRILNRAFGPGGWGLAPRGETTISDRQVSREYALVCLGRLVSIARGEQEYFDVTGVSMAMEGAKSNALMRACKDLGIASELWDPRYVRRFKKENCRELFGEHVATKKRKKLWIKKGDTLEYPWKATTFGS